MVTEDDIIATIYHAVPEVVETKLRNEGGVLEITVYVDRYAADWYPSGQHGPTTRGIAQAIDKVLPVGVGTRGERTVQVEGRPISFTMREIGGLDSSPDGPRDLRAEAKREGLTGTGGDYPPR